ncbi:hypothetical protein EDB81DRAFT_700447 [Dactylonectria macrodidyma]|uniref:Protein kinase domain-containing protein n=1 Tax=Dactylonectria macrodidyma TaxID=307937 RepID=A0A9P9IGX4_9HYPO|nr:hypothetical protein EDB81DRAFT_700447 [Dactylonectria macrodidyma]
MADEQPLQALGVTPDTIWGDTDGNIVYAQILGDGRAIIFYFVCTPTFRRYRPSALQTRVVCAFHNHEVSDESSTFRDQSAMRSAIWSAIATVWPGCRTDPVVRRVGTVVELTSTGDGIRWQAAQSPAFGQYIETFVDVKPSDLAPYDHSRPYDQPRPYDHSRPVVDISAIILLEAAGDIGSCCRQVRVRMNSGESPLYMFVSVLRQPGIGLHGQPELGPHGDSVLVGHLTPWFINGRLETVIAAAAKPGGREIPFRLKAKWCHQMASAIAHTHRVMHTFHTNIHGGSFIIGDDENLSLIDWEVTSARASTLAPEADGTFTVEERTDGESGVTQLFYKEHAAGPERRIMPKGSGKQSFNVSDVFFKWGTTCPRATEMAEVFSLGRMMWMLITQTPDNFDEVEHPNDVRICWGDTINLPAHWVGMVEQCMEKDPNKRPSAVDVARFWEAEASLLAPDADWSVPIPPV